MSQNKLNRRRFLQTASAGAAAAALTPAGLFVQGSAGHDREATLALLGGPPVRTAPFPSWPVIDQNDRATWQKVLSTGQWGRLNGSYANAFEKAYAERLGTKYCTVTANGTSALFAALNALGVGPGDEVLMPPYTFVATINVVLLQYALPVFVDSAAVRKIHRQSGALMKTPAR